MKKLVLSVLCCCIAAMASALDSAAWMAKARECAQGGYMIDSGETTDDGFYCLVLVAVSKLEKMTDIEKQGEACLEAKRKIAAYIHGETMSGERKVENRKLTKRIETKVEAFMRGTRVVGEVTSDGTSYMVCVTTEHLQDQSAAFAKAQAKTGDVDTVMAIGEGGTPEEALAKAKQSAIEQVLGSVVVGRDSVDTKKGGFHGQARAATDGMVESYRYANGTGAVKTENGWRVEILAKVSRDNPFNRIVFYIEAPQKSTVKRLAGLFTEAGVRVTENPDVASHIVRCTEEFADYVHPATKRKGVRMIDFGVRIQNMKTGEEYFSLVGDARVHSCVGKDVTRQKDLCSEKALEKALPALKQGILDTVARIMRRTQEKAN